MIDMNFIPLSGPKGNFYKMGIFFKNGEDRKRYFDNIFKRIPDSWDNVVYYTNCIYFTEINSNIDYNIYLFVIGNYVKEYDLDLIVYDKTIEPDEKFSDWSKEPPEPIDIQEIIEVTGEQNEN